MNLSFDIKKAAVSRQRLFHHYPSSSTLIQGTALKIDYPTNFRAFLNMRIHGESSPHASGW